MLPLRENNRLTICEPSDSFVMYTLLLHRAPAMKRLSSGKRIVLLMDNVGDQKIRKNLKAALESINTKMRFFSPTFTDVLPPADSFVIQKIKKAWKTSWEEHKAHLL